MHSRYLQLPSDHLGRRVHLWQYGHRGEPVVVFPTASGMAHEWQSSGAIDAISDLLEAGRVRLYCPESNVAQAWTHPTEPPEERMVRHRAYERFVVEELMQHIGEDVGQRQVRVGAVGVSFGAFYASNMALKAPEHFRWAIGMSGRYDPTPFLDGYTGEETWFVHPMAYVPGLKGEALDRVRRRTHLTLVVGQGAYEGNCLPETLRLAKTLEAAGIPHELDVWGQDVAHQWTWWRRQLRFHFLRRFAR